MLDGLGLSEPKGFACIYPTHRSSKTTRCTFFSAVEFSFRHDAYSLLRSVVRLISDLYLEKRLYASMLHKIVTLAEITCYLHDINLYP